MRTRAHLTAALAVLASCALMSSSALGQAEHRGIQPRTAPDTPSFETPRTALVIGNGHYRAGPLKNPNADAKLVAASLRSVGFDVDERHDLDREEMVRAIRRFGDRLKDGGVGVFYFAGHGMQVDGRSYLVPVGAHIAVEADVGLEAVDAARVLARMEEARNELNLVVLDACRNNPIATATRSREGGLAFLDAPTGTLIAYATAPGRTATDGIGAHSLYSLAFAEELRRPGLRVEDVFKRVRKRVHKATRGNQVPWESSSLEGDFYFLPEGITAAPIAPEARLADRPTREPQPPAPIDGGDEVVNADAYYVTSDDAGDEEAGAGDDGYQLGAAAEEEMSDEELERVLAAQQQVRADNVRYAQLKDQLNEEEARKSIAGWTSTGCLTLGAVSCVSLIAGNVLFFYGAQQLNNFDEGSSERTLWTLASTCGGCGAFVCALPIIPAFLGSLGCGGWWFYEGENVDETTVEIVRLDPGFGAEDKPEDEAIEREAQSY